MLSGRGDSRRRWLPHLLLFVVVLIWSGNTVISKLVLHDAPAAQPALGEQPTAMTLICGAVILVGIWLVNRPRTVRREQVAIDPLPAIGPLER
jgi:drug/metabolite transporter (DMT)-like permease